MNDTHKALLIGLCSRVLVIAVFVITSFFLPSTRNLAADQSKIPIVSLFDRWDSGYYISIANYGYRSGYPDLVFWFSKGVGSSFATPLVRPEWAFFPLYPAAMRVVSLLFMPFSSAANAVDLAGFAVSNVAFFLSVYFFYKLTKKIFNSAQLALISTVFFSFWGGTVFYSAIYSEALFMALALAAFYFLEEDKLPIAALFGFLASFTRSDGFLVFIPFLIYAIQSVKNKPKAVRLSVCSAIVASPFLIFQLIGYVSAGGFFPITVLTRTLYWKSYPFLWQQFGSINPGYSLFYGVGLALILLPAAYFVSHALSGSAEDNLKREADLLKYWAFYAAMTVILLSDSLVYSTVRYAVPMLPIYWVSAIIYTKNRQAGTAIFMVMTGMLIIGCMLFEARGYFM